MCGIAGILYLDRGRAPEEELLQRMGQTIAHRGPDGSGTFRDLGVGLVHRRLSIIDLEGGAQPIANEDHSIQVVFNGELYNYRELRDDLQARGHQFRTASDTEVLVHLYEELGERLVERLRGMFAFAIWDSRRQRLLLGRDRVGQKPLFVYRDPRQVIFASEIKAILACPDVDRTLDLEAVEDYFCYGVIPGPRSIFRRITKLPAAHTQLFEPPQAHPPRRYWEFRPEVDEQLTVDQWTAEIRDKLEETVRAHRIADVPVGAFLSGGIDSSVVLAVASRQESQPLTAFSIGFQEARFSELPHAREIAAKFGCELIEEVVTPTAVSSLDDLTKHYDEPFADSSAIPTMHVARLAAQHVKVVLSGDGGDEAFGGYARYAHDLFEDRLRSWVPPWLRPFPLGALAQVWPKADWLPRALRAKTLLTNLSLPPCDAYANTLSITRNPLRRRLLNGDVRAQLNGYRPEQTVAQLYHGARQDPLTSMIAADIGMLLPDDFLTKVDRASMAFGLEVRPPLVDHELLELAGRIPARWKIAAGETKWIFKRAYRQELPETILKRPKQGFELPIDQWLRGPLRELFHDCVLSENSPVGSYLDQNQCRQLERAHRAGQGRFGNVLWALLVFASWADRYLHAPVAS